MSVILKDFVAFCYKSCRNTIEHLPQRELLSQGNREALVGRSDASILGKVLNGCLQPSVAGQLMMAEQARV